MSDQKCIELAKEINALENKIKEREGPFNEGVKLLVPLADEVTEKNQAKLKELKDKYDSLCS